MKNILFIAYEFPPLSRGGVYRPMGFVKYLRAFGLNPIVITLAEKDFPKVYGAQKLDYTLGAGNIDNIEKVEVSSTKILNQELPAIKAFINIFFSVGGREAKGWKEDFDLKIKETILKYNPVALLVTAPPFSVIESAIDAAQKYKLPLITDFRDALSQWNINPYGSRVHYWKTLKNEYQYLKKSSAVVVTSKQTIADFKQIHPAIPASKFHYIPNGFEGVLDEWSPLSKKEIFTIGYVGSFYYSPESRSNMFVPWWKKKGHKIFQFSPHKEDWLYRSPYFFFKTLAKLTTDKPAWRKKIKVIFAGNIPDWLPQMIKEFSLNDMIELKGLISHAESLQFQKECDTLLITSSKKINGLDYSIAGKTFEYFKSQKPIIAFAAEGAQKDILAESGMALLCNPDDIVGSAKKMEEFFNGNLTLFPDFPFIQNFERKRLTEKLAKLILETVTK